MNVIEAHELSKAFWIPSIRRDTVREQVLGLLRPRRFRQLRVLDEVSFHVSRGETLGIMGRNGSGKSTLLRIVCGVFPPDRGSIITRGAITPILQLGVGWDPELDAIDNVCLVGTVMGVPLRQLRGSMDRILEFAEVAEFARLKLKHYSSGMASRLGYAVAFEAVREVLVLDEIFAVGDAGFRARCEQRYRELRALGQTVLLVSHDPRTVSTFCDRALLLEGGRIVAEGTGKTIAEQYLSTVGDARPTVGSAR